MLSLFDPKLCCEEKSLIIVILVWFRCDHTMIITIIVVLILAINESLGSVEYQSFGVQIISRINLILTQAKVNCLKDLIRTINKVLSKFSRESKNWKLQDERSPLKILKDLKNTSAYICWNIVL